MTRVTDGCAFTGSWAEVGQYNLLAPKLHLWRQVSSRLIQEWLMLFGLFRSLSLSSGLSLCLSVCVCLSFFLSVCLWISIGISLWISIWIPFLDLFLDLSVFVCACLCPCLSLSLLASLLTFFVCLGKFVYILPFQCTELINTRRTSVFVCAGVTRNKPSSSLILALLLIEFTSHMCWSRRSLRPN